MKHGFLYPTAIIDWYSRCIVGWDVGNTHGYHYGHLMPVKKAFKEAKPLIIKLGFTLGGSQFTSDKYIEFI